MKKRIYDAKNTNYNRLKSNKKRRYKEHSHQKAVFDLAKAYETQYPELKLMTGSLAGVNLGPIVGKRAKDTGHKPGFPDIHLPTAHGQWFSLYIELKTTEGRASSDQLRIATMLRGEGHMVQFIVGSQPAWDLIMKYIKLPKLRITKGEKPDAKKPDETTKAQLPEHRPENPLQISNGAPGGGQESGV